MSDEKDGGAAFACAAENGHQAGMTLRDYMAGQALAGAAADPDAFGENEACAAWCYRMADEMIEARKK